MASTIKHTSSVSVFSGPFIKLKSVSALVLSFILIVVNLYSNLEKFMIIGGISSRIVSNTLGGGIVSFGIFIGVSITVSTISHPTPFVASNSLCGVPIRVIPSLL